MVRLLHNIGTYQHSNYNTIEQVVASINRGERLTFDGVYLNVWQNRKFLKFFKQKPILFVMGEFVGRDNKFDTHNGLPLERYCDWNQIMDLVVNHDFELGWHTWSHLDLTLISEEQIIREITPPFPMRHFAYPYGKVNVRIAELVRQAGFLEAWSVDQGDNSQFQRKRLYL
jgi:peptidoglycan/xylan/chitin deacetylase (PgdA/CDA1 family)